MIVDTHVVLWWLEDSPRLSRRVRRLLADGDRQMFWSLGSSWEVAIKVSGGRLTIPTSIGDFLGTVVPDTGLSLLPISTAHIVQVAALPHHHHDPFDRLLVAQAITERLPVVTADAAFADYDVEVVW